MSSSKVLQITTKVEVDSKMCIQMVVVAVVIAVNFLADRQEVKTAREASQQVSKPASQPSSQPAGRDLEKRIGALSLYVTHSLLIVLERF